jgi:hypothetical protein
LNDGGATRLSLGVATIAVILIQMLALELVVNTLFQRGRLGFGKADLQHIEGLIAATNVVAGCAGHTDFHKTEEVIHNGRITGSNLILPEHKSLVGWVGFLGGNIDFERLLHSLV